MGRALGFRASLVLRKEGLWTWERLAWARGARFQEKMRGWGLGEEAWPGNRMKGGARAREWGSGSHGFRQWQFRSSGSQECQFRGVPLPGIPLSRRHSPGTPPTPALEPLMALLCCGPAHSPGPAPKAASGLAIGAALCCPPTAAGEAHDSRPCVGP